MELGTFGAVMAFASQVASESAEFYKAACEQVKDPGLREILEALRDGAKKDRASMEQARRENVTEMILEPIAGLRREDYEVTEGVATPEADAEIVEAAIRLEERNRRFFQDASARLPLPEVARVFRKVARRSEENPETLRALMK